MKNKLRKIVVNDMVFLWRIDEKYIAYGGGSEHYYARVKAIVFKEGLKNTPLTVVFDIKESAYVGNLITSHGAEVNLHQPRNIRMLIEEGVNQGWAPDKSRMTIEDGLGIYKRRGFNVGDIAHKVC